MYVFKCAPLTYNGERQIPFEKCCKFYICYELCNERYMRTVLDNDRVGDILFLPDGPSSLRIQFVDRKSKMSITIRCSIAELQQLLLQCHLKVVFDQMDHPVVDYPK